MQTNKDHSSRKGSRFRQNRQRSFDAIEAKTIIIRPSRGWVPIKVKDIWEYRELLYFLTWRDIKVRYKQTVLGAAWAVLQPFLTMVVFSIFFGRLAKLPSDNIPYPIFSYSALVIWTFFANGVTLSSNSMVTEANTIKKVYFPRLAIPIAAVISGVVDLVLAFIVLLGMMAFYWNNAYGFSVLASIVLFACFHHCPRSGFLVVCHERYVSRCAICCSIPCPDLAFCYTHCLFRELVKRHLEDSLRVESYGGRSRRFSLGIIGS